MKVNVYVAVGGAAARRICWYMGTSDAQVEHAMRMLLYLSPQTAFLLRDADGDLVPVSSTLPNGQQYTVVLQEDLALVSGSTSAINNSITSPMTSASSPKRRRLELPTEASAASPMVGATTVITTAAHQPSTPPRSIATVIQQFVDTFTSPIANDDNVNFIPNTGRFALYALYSKLVQDRRFHPKREDVFYKMTSMHGKVDRQRVNRYYQCRVENGVGTEVVHCKPQGKGVLLRRYRVVISVEELQEAVKSTPFVSLLRLDPKEVAALYMRFVDSFNPIAKSIYRAQSSSKHGDSEAADAEQVVLRV
ncbi:hypothetical protein PHYSODRAFT_502486 [Phytophthora sojae]|uniref:Uncharacterized protein n=1 Tax=Phytophthora sojae (strain P6497) TaxID=1094619 RepID=G4ZCZ7_PHYSP|nr:hypothetical protein PHYSODRAFT_502486 [Phytophthora sojae]EGZ18945.1 hypothetical protein PHYSODRAFT_502486 [Phytophthora sojae]|eukprot:XP_009528003.1 hypothetical protein PHYSODRAFT_502486 [Phytophthora sojae]